MINAVSSVSVDLTRPKKSKSKRIVGAVAFSTVPKILAIPLKIPIAKGVSKIQKQLSQSEIRTVNTAIDNVLYKATLLGKKGVTIENYNKIPPNHSSFPDKIYELFNLGSQIAKGENAGFINKEGSAKNTILVNRNKAPMLTFHELGHAFNFNDSTFWKSVQKTRKSPVVLASIFALTPTLTKEEKPQKEKALTKTQKIKNNIRKMSPFLAFISMLPILSEEMMASIRGYSWAKSLLDKNLSKKVLKTNVVIYTSYLLSALGFSLMAAVGKKVKDNSQTK